MDDQSLKSTSSPAGSDGPAVIIAKLNDDCSHTVVGMETLGIPVINIAPIPSNSAETVEIKGSPNNKQGLHHKKCALNQSSNLLSIECQNDSKLCGRCHGTKSVRCEMSPESHIGENNNKRAKLIEEYCDFNCRDDNSNDIDVDILRDAILQTQMKGSDEAQHSTSVQLRSTKDIKIEGK